MNSISEGADSTADQLAGSYGRKSDENSEGLKGQFIGNRQRAKSDRFTIPDSPEFRFEDDDTTGVSKSRRGFDRLLQVVQSGEAPFKRVYIKDRTRFGRWSDPRYGFFLEVLFEQSGVKIVYSENEKHVDYAGEFSPDMIGMFLKEAVDGVVASQERERLIKRVTGGMRYSVLRGFYPGSTAPYGLERWLADESTGEFLEPIPEGQTITKAGCRYKLKWRQDGSRGVIQEIFQQLEAGESLAAVARNLNERNTPTPSGRGIWRSEAIRRIANRPLSCGDLVWGRSTRTGEPATLEDAEIEGAQAILYPNFVPDAPVTREQWNDVQQILKGNRERCHQRKASTPEFLLSGLIACAECQAGYHGHTSTRNGKVRRRYYRHSQSDSKLSCCGMNRYLRAEEIEDQVMRLVTDVLADGRIEELTSKAIQERMAFSTSEDHSKKISETEKQISKYEEAIRRMKREIALADSETERRIADEEAASFGKKADHLRVQLSDLVEEQNRLSSLACRKATLANRTRDLLAVLEQGQPRDRKEVVASVVHEIRVAVDLTDARVSIRAL